MGVMLIAAGSYLAILSLKAFIPSTISKFYDAHSPQARAAMQLILGPNHENRPPQRAVLGANSIEERNKRKMMERDDKAKGKGSYAKMNDPNVQQPANQVDGPNNPFEVRKAETVDDRDMPIFITYIWKRSCMAFMMYMNAIMMTIVMEFSFSSIYTNNVMAMQLVLYVFRVLSDL
jgi:hypothetical protein